MAVIAIAVNDAEARRKSARDGTAPYALAAETTRPMTCTDNKTKEKIRALLFQALDLALVDHVQHLYEVWMRDSQGQPARARVGIEKGIDAYIHAQRAVAQWEVMTCESAQ